MTPTIPGFYWAKWRSAAPGTADSCAGADAEWEVVVVWENGPDPDSPEHLLAHVGGIAKAQGLHRFEWGPGPLEVPNG